MFFFLLYYKLYCIVFYLYIIWYAHAILFRSSLIFLLQHLIVKSVSCSSIKSTECPKVMRFYIYIARMGSDTLIPSRGHFGTLDIFRNSLPIVRVTMFSHHVKYTYHTYKYMIGIEVVLTSKWQTCNQNVLFIRGNIYRASQSNLIMPPTYKSFMCKIHFV